MNLQTYIPIIMVIVGIVVYLIYMKRDKLKEMFKGGGGSKAGGGATPNLDLYSRDLTQLARENRLDPVIDRENEIERVIQILSRRRKNNPILLGLAGVGKTAIIEGLAQRVIAGKVPQSIRKKRVLALNVSGLIAGTKYRGEFEQRLKKVMDEIRSSKRNIILFIDEVHLIVQSKGAEGALDPSDIIKPALARGDLQAIGATTTEEYEQYIKPEESLERRFQPVMVNEPDPEMTFMILQGIKSVYETHHEVKLPDKVLRAASVLSDRYIKNRTLPDKAIDLIDEAAAKVRLDIIRIPDRIKEVDEKIKLIQEKQNNKSIDAGKADERLTQLKQEKQILEEMKKQDEDGKKPIVTIEDIKKIVADWVNIPVIDIGNEANEFDIEAHLKDEGY